MVITADQPRILPQQRNEELSSTAGGSNRRVEPQVQWHIHLQGSNSQNMLHAYLFLLDREKHKTPCIKPLPEYLS